MANEPFMDRWTLNGTEVLLQDHGRDQPNGVPVLDENAKLPLTYLPQNYTSWLKVDPRDPLHDSFDAWLAKLPYAKDLGKKYTSVPVSWDYGTGALCVDAIVFKGMIFFNCLFGAIGSKDYGATWTRYTDIDTTQTFGTSMFAVFNNELYYINAIRNGSVYTVRLFKTSDGEHWSEITSLIPFTTTTGATIVATEDRLLIWQPLSHTIVYRIDKQGNVDNVSAIRSDTQVEMSLPTVGWYCNIKGNIAVTKSNSALWYSEDFGATWTISTGVGSKRFSCPGIDVNKETGTIITCAIGLNSATSMDFYRSTDGGKTFTIVYTTPETVYTGNLNFIPNCVNGVWFALVGTYPSGAVNYVSFDDGITWQATTGNVPDALRRVGYTHGVYSTGPLYSTNGLHWVAADTSEAIYNDFQFACIGYQGVLCTAGGKGVNRSGIPIWLPPTT